MNRKPFVRSLNDAQRPFYVGIDLGGTNIKLGVVDSTGATFYRHSIPTEHERGADDGAQRMGQAVRDAMTTLSLRPKRDVACVGLGSPGTMDIPRGMLLQPVNLPSWRQYPLRDRVAEQCGLPVTFENDANAAAYGEHWVGGGRQYHSLVLLTLGTGVGCGIIIGDMILDGEHSHGGESGHVLVDPSDDAPLCGCGKRGCLEAYASATGLVSRVRTMIDAGRKTSLTARLKAGATLDGLTVAQAAEAGDALALSAIMEGARWLGIGIVTLMHTIDPNVVLLGGAMTFGGERHPLGKKFLARIQEEVGRRAFPVLAQNTKIRYAKLGGNAGYIGAAGIARLEHLGLRPAGLPSPKRKRRA
jgi:glucokinase